MDTTVEIFTYTAVALIGSIAVHKFADKFSKLVRNVFFGDPASYYKAFYNNPSHDDREESSSVLIDEDGVRHEKEDIELNEMD